MAFMSNTSESLRQARRAMIENHLMGRDIRDPRVLSAMEKTPREEFVPQDCRLRAYDDYPLSIGYGQTISQPYIVALMAQCLEIGPEDNVLEIGAGCGYQAAVLSHLARHVDTVEILEPLAARARKTLETLGYSNVTVILGDGAHGWRENAPYDKIIAAATARKPPEALEEQLAEGGKIILPLGGPHLQDLSLGEKVRGKITYKTVTYVRFVPMTGDAQLL